MGDNEVKWPTANAPILHVHGQDGPHDDLLIEGSPRALRRLVNLLRRALSGGGASDDFYVNDGEGFTVLAVRLRRDVEVQQAATPYTNEAFKYCGADDPWKRALERTEPKARRAALEGRGDG